MFRFLCVPQVLFFMVPRSSMNEGRKRKKGVRFASSHVCLLFRKRGPAGAALTACCCRYIGVKLPPKVGRSKSDRCAVFILTGGVRCILYTPTGAQPTTNGIHCSHYLNKYQTPGTKHQSGRELLQGTIYIVKGPNIDGKNNREIYRFLCVP